MVKQGIQETDYSPHIHDSIRNHRLIKEFHFCDFDNRNAVNVRIESIFDFMFPNEYVCSTNSSIESK